MITVAFGLVLILAGVLALLWLRSLRVITEQAALIRCQAGRLAAHQAATAVAALCPDAAALIPIEAERYLASLPTEES